MKVLDTIEVLKQKLDLYRPEDRQQILEWEKQVQAALEKLSVKEIEAIKIVRDKYAQDLKTINVLLQSDEDMSQEERKVMFARKRWIKEFLTMFNEAEDTIAAIEQSVAAELE